MRWNIWPMILLLLWGKIAAGAVTETVQGNFAVRFPPRYEAGDDVLEELRLLERCVRIQGRFESTGTARPFLLVLDEKMPPGTACWLGSGANAALHVSSDSATWHQQTHPGREIVNGLIRSRMNLPPASTELHWPNWVADGLWADFQARRRDGLRIIRLPWLPMLRNAVDAGGSPGIRAENLRNGMDQPTGVSRTLYLERARLLLSVSGRLSTGRQNLLADYLELMRRQAAPPEECFRRIFAEAVRKRENAAPLKAARPETPGDEQEALEQYAARMLFSAYAPLSGDGIAKRLETIGQVRYRREDNAPEALAELEDLPLLVSRYPACAPIPRRKIAELNQLAALAPLELRGEIFAVTAALAGTVKNQDGQGREIRRSWEALQRKVRWLRQTDALLNRWEEKTLPLLHDYRLLLDAPARRAAPPERLRRLLESAEE